MLGDLGRIRPAATAKGGFSILVSNILVSNIVEPFLSSLPLSAPSKKDLLWFCRFASFGGRDLAIPTLSQRDSWLHGLLYKYTVL